MYKNYRIVVAAFLHDPTVTISKLKCCNGQLIVDSRKVHSWLHTDIADSACEHTRKVQSLFQCDQGIVLGKAFDRFDCYPDEVLNVAIDLKSALPIGSAVYDMIVPDIIKISTSTASGVEVFDLLVAGPQRHRVLLHQSTWPAHGSCGILSFHVQSHHHPGGRRPMRLCMHRRVWVVVSLIRLLCVLSDLSHGCSGKVQVGDLTTTTAATVMDSRSNHYELRKKRALQSSKLAIDGYMLVTSSGLVPAQVCTKRPLDLSFCSVYDKYVEKKSKKWYMHSFLFKMMIAYWISTTSSTVMN